MHRHVAAALLLSAAVDAAAAEATLTAVADASIYGGVAAFEQNADGAGPYVWTAVTAAGVVRRGLVRFDLSSIPAGAQVQQATLSLYLSRAQDLDPLVAAHRLTAAWTEGPANGGSQGHGAAAAAGDVTWLRRSHPASPWAQPGGDFDPQPSATTTLGFPGQAYAWGPTPQLRADVQGWLDAPAGNHGWILIGDESHTRNAKRFESRAAGAAARPTLRIVYELPLVADGDIPVPGWAAAVLGAAVVGAMARRRAGRSAVRTDVPADSRDTRMT